jgi:hypothetical protein
MITVMKSLVLGFLFATLTWAHMPAAHADTPAEVFAGINDGWPPAYASLVPRIAKDRSYIVLTMIEPSVPMDLRSSELFRRSYVLDGISQNFGKPILGHNMVAWQCARPNGKTVRGATAITGEESGQSDNMVRNGWGLTAIMSTYSDGFLQASWSVGQTVQTRSEKGERVWGAVFEVEPSQCEQMLGFLKTFVFHPHHPMTQFGLTVDPEKMEGGGCGSWAASLLHQAHLFPEDVHAAFKRTLTAPAFMFGQGLISPPDTAPYVLRSVAPGNANSVSLLHFINGPWTGTGPQETLHMTDPELLIFSVRTLQQFYLQALQTGEERGAFPQGTSAQMQNAYFARYPHQRVVRSQTPVIELPDVITSAATIPNFATIVREFPIDQNFDAHTQTIYQSLRNWWGIKQQQGYQSELVFDKKIGFLILQKSSSAPTVRPAY